MNRKVAPQSRAKIGSPPARSRPDPALPLIPASVMIFTQNEEVNLPACLESLSWCDDIIVVDSYSEDGTEQICKAAQARFFQHGFEGFGEQRNWALDHTRPKYEWVLILDADERVPPALVDELRCVLAAAPVQIAAYRLRRRFHLWGRWLPRSSLYPTWVVRLVRLGRVRYRNRGHAETQEVDGEIGELTEDLIDENLKGIEAWLVRQSRYAVRDAMFELEQESNPVSLRSLFSLDPLERRPALKRLVQRVPGRALFYFLYSYFLRLGFLEGRDGLTLCKMRSLYQQMIVVSKHELRKTKRY